MANVTLAVQQISVDGVVPTYLTDVDDAADTYLVPNNGQVYLHFKKSGAGIATITFLTPITVGGLAVANPTVAIPATTGDKMIGPFPPNIYNNGANLEFTTDNVTGLTVAAVRLGL